MLFDKSLIAKNKVWKILEYDPTDSVEYFKKYPSGYYSKYDKYGRIIFENAYAPYGSGKEWTPNEFLNYYLYDSLDNQVGFIQINNNYYYPISSISLQSYDTAANKVRTVSLKEGNQINSKLEFKEKDIPEKKIFFYDTVQINKILKRIYLTSDSSSRFDLFYNKNKLIDSTIYYAKCHGQSVEFDCHTVISYEYYKNSGQKRIEKEIQYNRKKLYSITVTYYYENGLIDKMQSHYTVNNSTCERKFKYYFME
jgi:hypothetical protein